MANDDPIAAAERTFVALAYGRTADRTVALQSLEDPAKDIDRAQVRRRLVRALSSDFRFASEEEAKGEDRDQRLEVQYARPWLFAALARLSRDDPEAEKIVREHLAATDEADKWVRFWILEGLLGAGVPDIESVARGIAESPDEQPLVRELAAAILASRGDETLLNQIRTSLSRNGKNRWATLRALSVVPIPSTVRPLRKIVRSGLYRGDTYDAIRALGMIPPQLPQAEPAAREIADFIQENRLDPKWEGTRIQALASLSRLKVEGTAPAILRELRDDNPAIVREAARALEQILGVRLAVARMVEAASSDSDLVAGFATALRWMDRDAVVRELEAIMVSGAPEAQEAGRAILSEIGGVSAFEILRARRDAMARYSQVLEEAESKVRSLFQESIVEARSGFRWAARMDVAVFVLGVVLLALSAGVILARGGTLDTWAGVGLTGGIGVLGVVYGTLIANPRRQVEEAVDHLMYLKVVFLSYLRQLHQVDQAFTRRVLENEPITAAQLGQFSLMVRDIMTNAIVTLTETEAGKVHTTNLPNLDLTRTLEPAPVPEPGLEVPAMRTAQPSRGMEGSHG